MVQSSNLPNALELNSWIRGAAQKDAPAFRQLYDACSPRLFGLALRIVRRPELAEEVLQESFIAIWNHSNEYQNSMSAPMTWMTTIVRNKSFDLLRRAGEEVDLDAGDFDQRVMAGARDMGANPADAFELSSEARALAACLAVLEEKQRDVIGLAFFHELSHGDVARRLALPVGTVKTWIRRGLARLHACLTGGRTA